MDLFLPPAIDDEGLSAFENGTLQNIQVAVEEQFIENNRSIHM